jgi:hypothetical protein
MDLREDRLAVQYRSMNCAPCCRQVSAAARRLLDIAQL